MKNRTKGFLFWKKRYYSICSRHQIYDENCDICNKGFWINIWKSKLDNFIFIYEKLFMNKK
jgi:hypothetical protein